VVHLTQGSNNLHFFYGADGSPAVVEYNGVSYGYVKNLQGDVIGIVNASGAFVVQYAYDAWGRLLSKTGGMASTLGTLNPFRYRGYVYAEETGLYYLRSRYYNPLWNRFVNSDALLNITSFVLGLNIYAYCNNVPVSFVDLDGMVSDAITTPYFNRNAIALSGTSGSSGGFLCAGTWNLTHALTKLFAPFVAFLFPTTTTLPTTKATPAHGEYSCAASVSIANPTDLSATSHELSPWEKQKEWHHIVAKMAQNARIAYYTLVHLEIPINGPDNLVLLAYPVHRRLHTNAYYGYVNAVIKTHTKEACTTVTHEKAFLLLWLNCVINWKL